MKLTFVPLTIVSALFIVSCSVNNADDESGIEEPALYEFNRNGESTISFDGQTTRLKMAEELTGAMVDFDNTTEALLLEMFRNETESGGDANPFSQASLNKATKNIKSKVAASRDYFFTNNTASADIKAQFETWLSAQVNDVFPNENTIAAPGQAGQIADGSSVRYVNGQGLEYNQVVAKSLIGALMTDQMLNNYLSPAVLDERENRTDNDAGDLEEGKNHTTMEHKWDEAYGYAYGTATNPANPNATIGDDDHFLGNYIASVDANPAFTGIAEDIFNAFKLGRAAIVAKNYEVRDEQATIIRKRVSKVIAVRAVHYLQSGKNALEQPNPAYGSAFHDLSEAYGFIYSLQFTRVPNTDTPYFTKSEVEELLTDLTDDGSNGLWDVTPETLNRLSQSIAERFDFTVEQAAG